MVILAHNVTMHASLNSEVEGHKFKYVGHVSLTFNHSAMLC